jgi:hypothetical protein
MSMPLMWITAMPGLAVPEPGLVRSTSWLVGNNPDQTG